MRGAAELDAQAAEALDPAAERQAERHVLVHAPHDVAGGEEAQVPRLERLLAMRGLQLGQAARIGRRRCGRRSRPGCA